MYASELRTALSSEEIDAIAARAAAEDSTESEQSISTGKPSSEYKGGKEGMNTSPAKLRPRLERQQRDGT